MPIVELESGQKLEFPDGTSEADIGAAVDEFVASSSGGQQSPTGGATPQSTSNVPSAASAQPQSQEGSFLDAIGSGLTLGLADEIGGGIAGLGQVAANTLGFGDGQTFDEAYTERRDQKRANQAGFAERNPATAFGAELAGGLLVPGLGVAGTAARGAAGLGRVAGVGAGSGAVAGFGASTEEDAGALAEDTLIGAALGGGTAGALKGAGDLVSAGGQRLFGGPGVTRNPAPTPASGLTGPQPGRASSQSAPNNKYQEHVQVLDDNDILTSPGQRSGNKAQIAAETTASETLLGGGFADTFDQQGTQVRSRLQELAGFTQEDAQSGIIDRVTLQNTRDRFAQRYTEALGDEPVRLDGQTFGDAVQRISRDNTALLPFEQKAQLTGVIDDFQNLVGSEPIDGQTYQRIRSRLGALERQTAQSNGVISQLYGDLRGSLDDAFSEAAGETAAGAKRAVDRDYRNFKVLEKAASAAGADVAGGEPTIRNIANKARDRAKGGTRDFADLADAAQNITTDRTPNSGTASRLFGLTSGAVGQGAAQGIRGAQALGIGTGSTAGQRVGANTLAAGLGPSIYNAIAGTQNIVDEQEEQARRDALLQSFGQAQQQLQGGQQ